MSHDPDSQTRRSSLCLPPKVRLLGGGGGGGFKLSMPLFHWRSSLCLPPKVISLKMGRFKLSRSPFHWGSFLSTGFYQRAFTKCEFSGSKLFLVAFGQVGNARLFTKC